MKGRTQADSCGNDRKKSKGRRKAKVDRIDHGSNLDCAEEAYGQEDQRRYQFQHAVNGYANQAEGQQE